MTTTSDQAALTTAEPPPKHRTTDRMSQALTATITSSAYGIALARLRLRACGLLGWQARVADPEYMYGDGHVP